MLLLESFLDNPWSLPIFILLIPFGLAVAWFIPMPGAPSGYDWWLHFRRMDRIYRLEKRARALNVGTLQPEPGNKVDEFFANCSKYEMVRELWTIARQYKDAWTMAENYWHEMRYLRAEGSTFRTVDKDQDTYVGYNGTDPGETIEGEKARKAKPSKMDLYINVVELDPVPSEGRSKNPSPTEGDAT